MRRTAPAPAPTPAPTPARAPAEGATTIPAGTGTARGAAPPHPPALGRALPPVPCRVPPGDGGRGGAAAGTAAAPPRPPPDPPTSRTPPMRVPSRRLWPSWRTSSAAFCTYRGRGIRRASGASWYRDGRAGTSPPPGPCRPGASL